jgi:hypothetical protein
VVHHLVVTKMVMAPEDNIDFLDLLGELLVFLDPRKKK